MPFKFEPLTSDDMAIVAHIGAESSRFMVKLQAFYIDAQQTLDRMRVDANRIASPEGRAQVLRILDGIQVNMARIDTKGH